MASGTEKPFRFRARLRISTRSPVQTVPENDFPHSIANYVMITMGGRLECFESTIGEDGYVDIDHTFSPIKRGEDFHNQIGWTGESSDAMKKCGILYNEEGDHKIKSHCVLWLYCKWTDEPLKTSEDKKVKQHLSRCFLLGTAVVDIAMVMRSCVDLTEEPTKIIVKGVEGIVPNNSFLCRHNFCETFSSCEVLGFPNSLSASEKSRLIESCDKLTMGVKEYEEEEKRFANPEDRDNGKGPDHSKHPFMPSPLRELAGCNEIVTLQQSIMQLLSMQSVREGRMELSDEMGAAFLSGATFLQVFGFAVCFTDMSELVRNMVLELPIPLSMAHVFAGIRVQGWSPKSVASMIRNDCAEDLYAVYLSIITAELMDTKQAEYFSDYCLYGTEPATPDDVNKNRQPTGSEGAGSGEERWFYRKWRGAYIRFRLRLTEDQRQVCTGEGLRDGMIADDCETSASFVMACHKTLMVIKAYLLRAGIIESGENGTVKDRTKRFMEKYDDMTKHPSNYNDVMETMFGDKPKERKGVADETFVSENPSFSGMTLGEKVDLVMALANILRQFDFHLDSCIGTANAAAVGAPKNTSGHCYLKSYVVHINTGTPLSSSVEGTRWVLQRMPVRGLEKLNPETVQNVNDLSMLLMEATKGGKLDYNKDTGTGLVQMQRLTGKATETTTFYMNVYVCGDSFKMTRKSTTDPATGKQTSVFTMGVPLGALLNAHGDGIDGSSGSGEVEVVSKTVRYELACNRIQQIPGSPKIQPEDIKQALKVIARATVIPPWKTDGRWSELFEKFMQCKEEKTAGGDVQSLRGSIARSKSFTRFVFTHQITHVTEESEAYMKDIMGSLNSVLIKPKSGEQFNVPVTKLHAEDAKKKTGKALDVLSTNKNLEGIGKLVTVERAFTCMSSLIVVCLIKNDTIATAHAKVIAWAKAINEAKSGVVDWSAAVKDSKRVNTTSSALAVAMNQRNVLPPSGIRHI